MERKQVFISYKSDERDQAMWTKAVLEKNGISCWMDTDVPAGANYAEEINAALMNAVAIVLIMSEKAKTSEHVKNEVNLASEYSKPIIAFFIEECVAEFDFDLPEEQRYNAFENRMEAVDNMLMCLRAIIESSDDDPYNFLEFMKERRKYLKDKRQREERKRAEEKKNEPISEQVKKSVCRGFLLRFTPYSKEYFTFPNPRLALNIHTFFIVLISLGLALMPVLAGLASANFNLLIILVIPLCTFLVLFIVGEALAGVLCRLICRLKSPLAVALVSAFTGNAMTWILFFIYMTVLELL